MTPKTLKDIFEKDEKNASGFITANTLRQEAIKHIKHIENNKPFIEWEMVEVINPEAKPLLKKVLTYEGKVLIGYLKYLFNIKESDL